jgi:hypothetical protein
MIPTAGPVKKLAKLLADQARVDDKIRDATVALTLVKKRVAESLAHHYVAIRSGVED